MLAVGLYALQLELTATVFMGAAFILWSVSFVQGLRVTWRNAHWKATLIVLLLFAAALANPIDKAIFTGDYAGLDWAITTFLIVFTGYVFAAIATEYAVRWLRRRTQ
jgi:hypothetical protein